MTDENMNRRDFLRAAGVAGLGSVRTAAGCKKEPQSPAPPAQSSETEQPPPAKLLQVARRKLGRLDVEVPMLCLGGMFDIPDNQVVLHKAIVGGTKGTRKT